MARTTIDRWIVRFEAEHFAGLLDKKRGPKEPSRKVWLPRMVQVYRLQKAHPDAGACRIWSLLAQPDISIRTVGRMMAFTTHGCTMTSPTCQSQDGNSLRKPSPTRPSITLSIGSFMA